MSADGGGDGYVPGVMYLIAIAVFIYIFCILL
jgi:hypothetical protein